MARLLRWFVPLVFWGSFFSANAQVWPIQSIDLASEGGAKSEVALPHFFRQAQSGLITFEWRVKLPEAVHSTRLPALLWPQPVQGASFWIGDELLYEIASSDEHALRNWYRPVLISIPKHLISTSNDTVIKVRQSGYLRGWFVAPMLAGDLADLRPWFDRYALLSQTLSVTINVLSGLIGLFLLGIGLRTQGSAYTYSGLSTIIWSLLFSLALLSDIPAQQWFFWRLALYLCTGWLIYFISLFMFSIFEQRISQRWRVAFFVYLNAGWLIFALGGVQTEYALDMYWTGLAVGIYVATTVWLITVSVFQKKCSKLVPFFIHALISSLFAFHDYILQAGWLPIELPSQSQPLWFYAALQPIYLTHLALPSFVVMALWMLAQDHLQKTHNALAHERQLQQQREKMISDIHDGVGSRINFLLWGLRSTPPTSKEIELELQRCMDELRFAINPIESGHETLHKALDDLCKRLQHQSERLAISYARNGTVGVVRSDLGIQLYKAAQECLSNAIRHSQASSIHIELEQTGHAVQVSIKDNGTGIPDWDEESQSQRNRRITALGLESLKQRMESKGGTAFIHSSSAGTCVVCRVPLAQA